MKAKRLSIWERIKRLETQFSEKREELENLVARHSDPSHTPEDFGITREIRRLRELVEDMGDSQ